MSLYDYNPQTAKPYRITNGQMVNPPPQLTKEFLIHHRLPVYIIANMKPISPLFLTVKPQSGGSMPLRILKQKDPQNVTAEFNHDMLAFGGQDLWAVINKGILKLVWPSDAEEMLGTTNPNAEVGAQISEWSASNAFTSPRVAEAQQGVPMVDNDPNAGTVDVNDVSPRVSGIVARFEAKDMKVEDALREFDLISEEMTEKDYAYVVANVTTGKVHEMAQQRLAELVTERTKANTKPAPKANPYVKQTAASKSEGAKATPTKTERVDVTKSLAKNKSGSVFDDDMSDLTEEEKAAVAAAEAAARARLPNRG